MKPQDSFGCAGHESIAQLKSHAEAGKRGISVIPRWNKSRREHKTVNTRPESLRHEQSCPAYDRGFRQLIHVGYKVAYELGDEYREALREHAGIIGRNVTHELLQRHILPLFCQTQ